MDSATICQQLVLLFLEVDAVIEEVVCCVVFCSIGSLFVCDIFRRYVNELDVEVPMSSAQVGYCRQKVTLGILQEEVTKVGKVAREGCSIEYCLPLLPSTA